MQQLKDRYPANLEAESPASPDDLEVNQRLLYDQIIDHYTAFLVDHYPGQLLINLDGKAGTGKSFIVMLISTKLQQLAAEYQRSNPILRVAPTGVAAHSIHGRTLHALFRLPIKFGKEYEKLPPQHLQAAQASLCGIQYLIIDEKSMIGLKLLFWLDQRCREIIPASSDQAFGGLNIVVAGDYCQLPPVMMKPLYYNGVLQNHQEVAARAIYRTFDKTIELNVVRRQSGQDSESTAFRAALDSLRDGNLTLQDWQLLATRVQAEVPSEITMFMDALRIYGTRDQVAEFNHTRLRDLKTPVYLAKATHTGLKAEKASSSEAGNVSAVIPLALGCRVMLTENIWTECGLVNGRLGTVRDIIWKHGDDWRHQPPFAILIKFDSYEGPVIDEDQRIVPIFRSKRDFYVGKEACSRTQFPLTNAYAITVHKAQGMTVDKAVLDISGRDFVPGLSYVAVSRVKTLRGILFERPFDYEHFQTPAGTTVQWRRANYQRRASEHIASGRRQGITAAGD